ncbi:NAD(P)H-binding protein [Streptomyces chartreusis]|uniref:NAD(P)H-binding protein n=1 Tax=Streptomyces chartreusis TaxID=1969 RepID=UPI003795201D
MTIAVLGATGMVGSRVIAESVARGHRVLALSRKPGDGDPNVTPVAVDVGDPEAVHEALAGVTATGTAAAGATATGTAAAGATATGTAAAGATATGTAAGEGGLARPRLGGPADGSPGESPESCVRTRRSLTTPRYRRPPRLRPGTQRPEGRVRSRRSLTTPRYRRPPRLRPGTQRPEGRVRWDHR